MNTSDAASHPSAQSGLSGPGLHLPLQSLIRRPPVCVAPDAPLREALERMTAERVGSVLVTVDDRAVGMLTLPDLPGQVLLAGQPLDTPVRALMQTRLHTLGAEHSGEDAARLMARHEVRHVVVTGADGRLLGVISQSDLYARLRQDVHTLGARIRDAADADALVEVAAAVRRFARQLLQDGTSAEALMLHLSSLNDALAARAIDLVRATHPDAGVLDRLRWCWLAFGSEGRMEQTFATDQDNGLLFEPPPGLTAEAVRPALMRFAAEINRLLVRLGFPACDGGIMAGEARCCLSFDEWAQAFSRWIATPHPEALMSAAIFFDLRPLHGDGALADALRRQVLTQARADRAFLRLLAESALQARPPLGLFGRWRLDHVDGAPHTLDLKTGAARVFADAARLYALSEGLHEHSTAGRLRALARSSRFASDDLPGAVRAFFFIQRLRLQKQAGEGRALPAGLANRMDPSSLADIDRVLLRHALKRARQLQTRIRLDWQIG
ncbi:DUF294 nucleotidyltransferase-like domain-containing protein [Methyloversatilis universalis]|uniref:DUF294 nucleotidyltransferase-like domain-containing protein n=1 Tax=Methyloversatilis universalis TaxID=378211 RepID=UPI00047717E9|nr:DUF294 nucleotidyltransferase-like domain-containing protein [Methyloversatilis universalis]